MKTKLGLFSDISALTNEDVAGRFLHAVPSTAQYGPICCPAHNTSVCRQEEKKNRKRLWKKMVRDVVSEVYYYINNFSL